MPTTPAATSPGSAWGRLPPPAEPSEMPGGSAAGTVVDSPKGRVDTSRRVARAVVELLESSGPAALTTTRVARQARVHRATVLRRWPRPERLLAEAARHSGLLESSAPATGSLTGDLLAFITLTERGVAGSRPLLRALLASDLSSRDDAQQVIAEYLAVREDALAEVLRRARLRGNRVHERSAPAVLAVVTGALWVQTLVRDAGMTPADLDRLVGAALAAARPAGHPGGTGSVPAARLP